MAGRAKVNHFHTEGLPHRIYQHNVLRFKIGVDQAQALELLQCRGHLLQNGPNHLQRQRTELVLLEEVVQVLLQHLKHQTGVASVLEALESPHKVVLLGLLPAQSGQDAHLDLALAGVRRIGSSVSHRHDLIGASLPTFDDLTERTTSQKLQHFVGVLHGAQHFVLDQLILRRHLSHSRLLSW